jgi:serine/threonine protein kinase/tetratricopeptide (TPR) repeat protein
MSAVSDWPRLDGEFEIVRAIGRGGAGEIFEAVRTGPAGFRKRVALKRLAPDRTRGTRGIERFLREARIAARLDHPNIVRVDELIVNEEGHFIVMELLRGANLSELRALGGTLSARAALAAAIQVLDALTYAHALCDEDGRPLGLLHRDLTPRNLFVCGNGLVKILDFGIAKLQGALTMVLTEKGRVMGTVDFMSPEQAQGGPIDARSDLYQLGATLYFLLSGRPPLGSGLTADVLARLLAEPAPPLAQACPELPPAVCELVDRSIAALPAGRFPNARAMREAAVAALATVGRGGRRELAELVARLPEALSAENPALLTPPDTAAATVQPVGDRPPSAARSALSRLRPAGATPTPLAARDRLVGRTLGEFKLIDRIGQGGLGAVYRAEQPPLAREAVVKVLLAEAASEQLLQRFLQEARLASRLDHPYAAHVYEFGAEPDGVLWIAMELVRGTPLSTVLVERGPLPAGELSPLLMRICEVVHTAHEQGIIHRDLKPSNVMVIEGAGCPLPKLLDFGISKHVMAPPGAASPAITPSALASAARSPATALTHQGLLIGSPPYMAPEQWRSPELADARTDLYALGVMTYELLTGRLPFVGDTTADLARAHARARAPSLGDGFPPALDAVIRRALAKTPSQRYPTVLDFAAAFRAVVEPGAEPIIRSPLPTQLAPRPHRRWGFAVAGALAAVALGAGALVLARWPQGDRAAPRRQTGALLPTSRRAVAVLDFANRSRDGRLDWVGRALGELVGRELGGPELRVLPGELVSRAATEAGLGDDPGELAPAARQLLGRNLQSDLLVTGSFEGRGSDPADPLQLEARLVDARTGRQVARAAQQASVETLVEASARLTEALAAQLGARRTLAVSARSLGWPAGTEASRLYANGLMRLRRDDALSAHQAFQRAAALAPQSPLLHGALATTWRLLGYEVRAGEEARRVLERLAGLDSEERLRSEGRYREALQDWAGAACAYTTLWRTFPDEPSYGLDLVRAQLAAGRTRDATATLIELRRRAPPDARDLRIDTAEAVAACGARDWSRCHAAALQALDWAQGQGTRLASAELLLVEGEASGNLGDEARARTAYQESSRLYGELGDRRGVAKSQLALGALLEQQGDTAGARNQYEQALAIERQLGDREQMATAIHRAGWVAWKRGELTEAAQALEIALALRRELGRPDAIAHAISSLAVVRASLGELLAAERGINDAVEIYRGTHDRGATAMALAQGGQLLTSVGRLADARRRIEEALAIRVELNEPLDVAETRVVLAQLLLAEGRAADAERMARDLTEVFIRERSLEGELRARGVVLAALLAEGRASDAQPLAAELAAMGEHSPTSDQRLEVKVLTARARAAVGSRAALAEAAQRLTAAAEEAERIGCQRWHRQAQLALADIEQAQGHAQGARARPLSARSAARSGLASPGARAEQPRR